MGHVSVAEHRAAVAQLLGDPERGPGPAAVETIPLDRFALGRRCAAEVVAVDDLPRFDSSAMDGYAAHPAPGGGLTFVVVGDVPAGSAADFAIGPGQAARVMTGAPVPDGAVGVVPVELTDAARSGPAPDMVTFSANVVEGRHIRRRAEDVRAGSVVAGAGAEITPALIALGRSAGVTTVTVHVPTRVAVVATGAELTAPGVDPGPGGIHESNSEMVAALAIRAGCEVTHVRTCPDDPDTLRALLDELTDAADVDVVVTTGGVSAGAHEVVRQVCEPLDAFRFVHLAMQPGGPQGLGRWRDRPVICLPGTPNGAFVAFEVLVRPALDERHGAAPRQPRPAAYTGSHRRTRTGRVQFITAVLSADGTVTAPDASHLTALAAATALIEVPEHVDELVAGDVVLVHRL